MQIGCRLTHQRMILYMVGIIAVMVFCACTNRREASAAGAMISITSTNSTAVSGEVVYVVITVKSDSEISGFEAYFSYDNRVLQFQTGGSVVFGNDDEFRIEDVERDSSSKTIKYSIKFLARRKGSTTITLKEPYNVFGASTSDKMSVSYNSLNIVVKRKAEAAQAPVSTAAQEVPKEGDASMKTMQPAETPAPTKKKKKKKKAKASPTPDPEATAEGLGRSKDLPETGVHAVKNGENIFLYGSSSIQITKPEKDRIPDGFGRTELVLDGQTITAYSLENQTDHSYVLVYGETEQAEGFYLYDKEQNILLPYDKVRAWYRSNAEGVVSAQESQAVLTAKRLKYIVGILIAFIGLMLLAVISLFMKYKGMDPDDIK